MAWIWTADTTVASTVYTTATTIFLLVRLQIILSSLNLNSINNNQQLQTETEDLTDKKDS